MTAKALLGILGIGAAAIVAGSFWDMFVERPGQFSRLPSHMTVPRYLHAATDLSNTFGGNVLITGGMSELAATPRTLSSAELFDTQTQKFVATGSMRMGRSEHRAVAFLMNRQLADVYVFGGFSPAAPGRALTLVEHYDPATGHFTDAGNLATARRSRFGADLIGFGKFLIAGGWGDDSQGNLPLNTAEVFDYSTRSSRVVSPATRRAFATAVELPDFRALVTGGDARAELYETASQSFTTLGGPQNSARVGHTTTRLGDGRVLLVGGASPFTTGQCIAPAEIFDPATRSFTRVGSLNQPRFDHTATRIPYHDAAGQLVDRVLIVGGVSCWTGANPPQTAEWVTIGLRSAEIFDVATGTFSRTGDLHTGRIGHTATLTNTGKVLIAGGRNRDHILNSAEIYIPPP